MANTRKIDQFKALSAGTVYAEFNASGLGDFWEFARRKGAVTWPQFRVLRTKLVAGCFAAMPCDNRPVREINAEKAARKR